MLSELALSRSLICCPVQPSSPGEPLGAKEGISSTNQLSIGGIEWKESMLKAPKSMCGRGWFRIGSLSISFTRKRLCRGASLASEEREVPPMQQVYMLLFHLSAKEVANCVATSTGNKAALPNVRKPQGQAEQVCVRSKMQPMLWCWTGSSRL